MDTSNTTTDTYLLEIPKADISLLKSLVKRMGWTYIKQHHGAQLTNKHLTIRRMGV